ncbi:MAG: O-antigen ligase family protein [Saprospiraceae bacterium]|nr:O-antigen ligase family protein [Saprospiraceae bacterium]
MDQATTRKFDYESAFLVLSFLFIASLLYSTFLLSVSMFGFAILALFQFEFSPFRCSWRKDMVKTLATFLDQPAWWAITLLFLIVLYGGLYSDDTSYWLSRVRLKIPFLLFPFGFYLFPSLSRHLFHRILYLLVLIMVLSSIPVLISMLIDYQTVLDNLSEGRPVTTPGSHIRYSLLLSLAFFSALLLWSRHFNWLTKNDRSILVSLAVYLFVFIHLLAVRSGIAVVYLTSAILIIRALILGQRRSLALGAGIILLVTPLVAYYSFTSFKNRIDYTLEDISKYQEASWNAYSDAERVLSVKAGIAIWRTSPWFGVGPGDLKNQMRVFYLKNYEKDTFLLPHNQFVSVAAGSGWLGLLLFLIAFFTPICITPYYRSPFLIVLFAITFFSMWVENTFETSVGVAFFVFFAFAGLKCASDERNT